MEELVKKFFKASDDNNWEVVNNIFADRVILDYESFGGKKENLKSEVIIKRWAAFLPGFDKTNHQLSNFKIDGNNLSADLVAEHYIEDNVWIVKGSYDIKFKDNQIIEFKFNFIEVSGDETLPEKAVERATPIVEKVIFESKGEELKGDLYYPIKYDSNKKYTGVVATGSWTTVKEQMAKNYALDLARLGFIVLTYDPRGFGESSGEVRYFEDPKMKIEDIKSAVTYLENLKNVDEIGALGICAGGGYTLVAASEDDRIKAVVTAAAWIHDGEAVKMFYGGEEGVEGRVKDSKLAEEKYIKEKIVEYIPTYSQTDDSAAMYDPNNWYDYYNNPNRGGIKEWSRDKFAVMSWEKWLRFNPRASAKSLTTPTLMIHSDGAVLPDYAKIYFEEIKTDDKKLIWLEVPKDVVGMHQFYFYDQEEEVSVSSFNASIWFKKYLNL